MRTVCERGGGDLDEIVVTGIRGSPRIVDEPQARRAGRRRRHRRRGHRQVPGHQSRRIAAAHHAACRSTASIGEGSKVTVRGVGPDFNLVLLNGRQMPASTHRRHGGASNSRAFDFANLASEAIAADRGVQDQPRQHADRRHRRDDQHQDRASARQPGPAHQLRRQGRHRHLGGQPARHLCRAIRSRRRSPASSATRSPTTNSASRSARATRSAISASTRPSVGNGWRPFARRREQLGHDSAAGRARLGRTSPTARTPTDIYSVPQNLGYSVNGIERKRTNGQLMLQFAPVDALTATLDYTYSENKVADAAQRAVGVVQLRPVDPVRGPMARSRRRSSIPKPSLPATSDLSMGGAKFATKNENKSLGFNSSGTSTNGFGLGARLSRLHRRIGRRQPVRLERGARRRGLLPRHDHGGFQRVISRS